MWGPLAHSPSNSSKPTAKEPSYGCLWSSSAAPCTPALCTGRSPVSPLPHPRPAALPRVAGKRRASASGAPAPLLTACHSGKTALAPGSPQVKRGQSSLPSSTTPVRIRSHKSFSATQHLPRSPPPLSPPMGRRDRRQAQNRPRLDEASEAPRDKRSGSAHSRARASAESLREPPSPEDAAGAGLCLETEHPRSRPPRAGPALPGLGPLRRRLPVTSQDAPASRSGDLGQRPWVRASVVPRLAAVTGVSAQARAALDLRPRER